VALTIDGIKFVNDKHPTCCGLACSDQGKESKTVPYDKLTDCDVTEPAGNACLCFVENILYTVNVDTASSGAVNADGVTKHELSLSGLSRPLDFKKAVWAMKRGTLPEGLDPEHRAVAERKILNASRVASAAPLANAAMDRGGDNGLAESSIPLLIEIRDELKTLNKTMTMKR
jgi:hypothetical protein